MDAGECFAGSNWGHGFTRMIKTRINTDMAIRIWQKQGGAWRVVIDVTNVHPK